MSEGPAPSVPVASEVPPESGLVYRTVTRYWPRIAVGLVAAVGLAEWLIQGFTANTRLQFYAFAWASTTGGLWFMFEKAEKALGAEGRSTVVGWLGDTDFRASVGSIPRQFALQFDRIFGAKHLTWTCFVRSSFASLLTVLAVLTAWLGIGGGTITTEHLAVPLDGSALTAVAFLEAFLFAGLLNFVPDYLSLMETRWAISAMHRRSRGLLTIFAADILLTAIISAGITWLLLIGTSSLELSQMRQMLLGQFQVYFWHVATFGLAEAPSLTRVTSRLVPLWVYFYSAFFTSVWLWIYAASVVVSRFLVKVGGGVGFLLKVTDVEHQPFRSMGFTAVVLTSLLFLAGLPLVLLS